jgi:hypothetical protein
VRAGRPDRGVVGPAAEFDSVLAESEMVDQGEGCEVLALPEASDEHSAEAGRRGEASGCVISDDKGAGAGEVRIPYIPGAGADQVEQVAGGVLRGASLRGDAATP